MKLVVRHYTQIEDQKWDDFVYENSMGYVYFLKDLIAWHRYKEYQNYSFCIMDEDTGTLYFMMQLHKRSKKKFFMTKSVLISQWGFVLKDNLPKKTLRKVHDCFLEYIHNLIKTEKIRKFNIQGFPALSEYNGPDKGNLINPCMFFNFEPSVRYTWLVNLNKTAEKLFSDCDETTRSMIKKIVAENKYNVIESDGSMADCKDYIALHKETYVRTKAEKDIIDDKYNEHIFKTLIPKKIARAFFLREKESAEAMACFIVLCYKNTVYSWWGGSKDDKEYGINRYLIFEILKMVQKDFNYQGYVEMGGAYPYLTKGKFKGLSDFKKCFGCFLYPIWTGHFCK